MVTKKEYAVQFEDVESVFLFPKGKRRRIKVTVPVASYKAGKTYIFALRKGSLAKKTAKIVKWKAGLEKETMEWL